jgi:hypothetical protein
MTTRLFIPAFVAVPRVLVGLLLPGLFLILLLFSQAVLAQNENQPRSNEEYEERSEKTFALFVSSQLNI